MLIDRLIGDGGERVGRAEVDPGLIIVEHGMDLSLRTGQHQV